MFVQNLLPTIYHDQVTDTFVFHQGNIPARLMKPGETRGRDGRGFDGEGFDHGVFVPFRLMFGDAPTIPIVQVSIDMSLSPQAEWDLGKALAPLRLDFFSALVERLVLTRIRDRSEGILIISGGLTIHTFEDFGAFSPSTAAIEYKLFEQAIVDAAAVPNVRPSFLLSVSQIQTDCLYALFVRGSPQLERRRLWR